MSSRAAAVLLAASLAGFLALALGDILTTSPTWDEPIHLASGYSTMTTGEHRVSAEHLPFSKWIAALPLLSMPLWPRHEPEAGARSLPFLKSAWDASPRSDGAWLQYAYLLFFAPRDTAMERFGVTGWGTPTTVSLPRSDFLNDAETAFRRARIGLLVVAGAGLVLLVACFSFELWGAWGAALSVTLLCFDPSFIAHAGLVTTDAGTAMLLFGTLYLFWRFTRGPSPANAAGFVSFFALAMLAKFSALLLLPMLALLIPAGGDKARRALLLVAALVVSYGAIWAAYGFRFAAAGTPMPIRSEVRFWYANEALLKQYPKGIPAGAAYPAQFPIGTAGRLLVKTHDLRLLPEPYLYGLAFVRGHSIRRASFLRGESSTVGFRSYFLWTFLYKTPLPTLVAIAAGLVAALRRRDRRRDLLFLLVPVAVYLAVSLRTNLNIGHRHILPIYPFLYVACGALPRRFLAAAGLSALSCLVVFTPFDVVVNRHLAYVNELAGGPRHGHEVLADSSLDWGQDLPRLSRWLEERGVREPVNLVYFGSADPRYYGIRFVNLEHAFWGAGEQSRPASQALVPGWLAISATKYRGVGEADPTLWQRRLARAELVDVVGYSILVFRLREPLAP